MGDAYEVLDVPPGAGAGAGASEVVGASSGAPAAADSGGTDTGPDLGVMDAYEMLDVEPEGVSFARVAGVDDGGPDTEGDDAYSILVADIAPAKAEPDGGDGDGDEGDNNTSQSSGPTQARGCYAYVDTDDVPVPEEEDPADAVAPPPPSPPPPEPAAASGPDQIFTQPFQSILDKPSVMPKQAEARMEAVNQKSSEFVAAALPVASQIVAETGKATRTIMPIDVGGIAGGVKFSVSGQFYKFAVDEGGLFGSDVFAAKGAGLELRALNELAAANIPSLHFALGCTVDVAGRRLSVSSVLPIGNTLCYGSADAGKTVYGVDDIPDLKAQEAVRQLASKLNLQEHLVRDKVVQLAGDVEGHMGSDARFYLLDLQRMFPPETPRLFLRCRYVPADGSPATDMDDVMDLATTPNATVRSVWPKALAKIKTKLAVADVRHVPCLYRRAWVVSAKRPDVGTPLNRRLSALVGVRVYGNAALLTVFGTGTEVLYELLRPELVLKHPNPLSSDSFTRWGMQDAARHNAETRAASTSLHNRAVPAAAAELVTVSDNEYSPAAVARVLHKHGVNLRHVGRVRGAVRSGPWVQLLLVEMIARAFRRRLFAAWRTLRDVNPVAVAETTAKQLATLLGKSPAARFFWCVEVKELLLTHFRFGLSPSELSWEYDLRRSLSPAHMPDLARSVLTLTGVVLACTEDALLSRRITAADITEVQPLVKRMEVPRAKVASLCDEATLTATRVQLELQLSHRESLLGPEHTYVIATMLNLAQVYLVQPKRYGNTAFQLLRRVLDLYVHLHGPDDDVTLNHKLHLATQLVLRSSRKSEAVELLEDLLRVYEGRGDNTGVLEVLVVLGQAIAPMDAPRSIAMFERGLAIAKSMHGDMHFHVARSLSQVAGMMGQVGRSAEELPALTAAYDMYGKLESVDGVSYQSYRAGLANLIGRAHLTRHNFAGAKEWFDRSLVAFAASIGTNTVSYLQVCVNKAMLHDTMGDSATALFQLDSVLSELRRIFKHGSELEIVSINNRATILANLGRFEEARTDMLQAYNMRRKAFGPNHPSTLQSAVSMGGVLMHLDRDGEASVWFKRAAFALKKTVGPRDGLLQACVQQLMGVMSSLQQQFGAQFNALTTQAMHAMQTGDTDTAMTAMQQAAQLLPADETAQFNLACIYSSRFKTSGNEADREAAFKHLTQAAEFGFGHPAHAKADSDLEPLHGDKRFDEAIALMEEFADMQAQRSAQMASLGMMGTPMGMGAATGMPGAASGTGLPAGHPMAGAAPTGGTPGQIMMMMGPGGQLIPVQVAGGAGGGMPTAAPAAGGMPGGMPQMQGLPPQVMAALQQQMAMAAQGMPSATMQMAPSDPYAAAAAAAAGSMAATGAPAAAPTATPTAGGVPVPVAPAPPVPPAGAAAPAPVAATAPAATVPTSVPAAEAPAPAPAPAPATTPQAAVPAATATQPPVPPAATAATAAAGAGGGGDDLPPAVATAPGGVVAVLSRGDSMGGAARTSLPLLQAFVQDTAKVTDDGKPYTVYNIAVTIGETGHFVSRRYRQFQSLHQELAPTAAHHGIALPPLPKGGITGFLGRNSSSRVTARTQAFNDFLAVVTASLPLRRHPSFMTFIEP